MKYGAHIYIWMGRWTDDELDRRIEAAASLGLDFLEVAVGDDLRLDPARVRRTAGACGIELALSPGGLWPMDCDLSVPGEGGRNGLEWHRRQIDRAAACGAKAYCGALYGHPGRVLPHPPTADENQRIADGLRVLAAHGVQAGVRLVIEPMSHFRTHLVNTPRQATDLVRQAGHPNLAVLLDTYHLCTEITSCSSAIRDVRNYLWGIHACESNRGVPGSGILPWADILGALRATAWDGWVGLESYNSTWDGGRFAWGRGMFHDVCPDGDEFVRRGLAFLRSALEG